MILSAEALDQAYKDLFHGNRRMRRRARKQLKRHFKAVQAEKSGPAYKQRKKVSR